MVIGGEGTPRTYTPRKCQVCGEEIPKGSRARFCEEHAAARVAESIRSQREKRGPDYDKWRPAY